MILSQESNAFKRLVDLSVQNLSFGGRGIGNVVEKYLLNPLGRAITDEGWERGSCYEIHDIVLQQDESAVISASRR